MWSRISEAFLALCAEENRAGVLATTPVGELRLLPEQAAYLHAKLASLNLTTRETTAVSLGLAYKSSEIAAIPDRWVGKNPSGSRWNDYAHAYQELNASLNRIARSLANRFGGVAEGATLEGWVDQVQHVTDYFSHCVSHRAVAEVAGLGWRGKHGLIVTPEFGPALRLATVFIPGVTEMPRRNLAGCGDCQACLTACPILKKGTALNDLNVYREMCRRRIDALALDDEVCGICVRRCWEAVSPDAPYRRSERLARQL